MTLRPSQEAAVTDAPPASQIEKVTYDDFKNFLEERGYNRKQAQVGWQRFCYRLLFIKKDFGLELVCADCDRIMPCICDNPERLPNRYSKYVLTRRWLVKLPDHALTTLGRQQADRMRGFVQHLRES